MKIYQSMGLFFVFLFCILGMGFDNVGSFIDFPSLQIVVVLSVAAMFFSSDIEVITGIPSLLKNDTLFNKAEDYKPYIRMFDNGSRYAIAGGMVGTLIGLILMLGNMSDVESIGPNMAVALISLLYGIMLSELVYQPIRHQLIERAELIGGLSEEEKQRNVNPVLQYVIGGVFLILLAFFVLLTTFSSSSRESAWEKRGITSVGLKNMSFSFKDTTLPFIKEASFSNDVLKDYMKEEVRVLNSAYDPKEPELRYHLTVYPESKLNKDEVVCRFSLGYFLHDKDSVEVLNYWKVFPYAVPYDSLHTILVENDSVSFSFDILLESDKATK